MRFGEREKRGWFGSLSDARVKARNSAKNSLVMEYIKALELYRSNNTSYPMHPGQETDQKCIGYNPALNEMCFVGSLPGSDFINAAFTTYMPNDFAHRGSVIANNGFNLNGVRYKCKDITCMQYQLIWELEKEITKCVSGSSETPLHGTRRCTYPKTN